MALIDHYVTATGTDGTFTYTLKDQLYNYYAVAYGYEGTSGTFTVSALATSSTITLAPIVIAGPTDPDVTRLWCVTRLGSEGAATDGIDGRWRMLNPPDNIAPTSGEETSSGGGIWYVDVPKVNMTVRILFKAGNHKDIAITTTSPDTIQVI